MTRNKSLRLKICGMRDPDNMLRVADEKPDYMGFIFYRDSKRAVGAQFMIPKGLSSQIKRVGVFVNESLSVLLDKIKTHSLDVIQLHGEESPLQCAELQKTGVEVIKVFGVGSAFDFESVTPYKRVVDYFMFDTKAAQYGGTGKSFDWRILTAYDQEVPFFLSGGLSPANVSEVSGLRGMNLYGLDVNSGVEVEPGIKDVEKVRKLMEEIGRLEN